MLNIMKNERGFAAVYGLVVLLLASITGTGLMLMTMRGRIGSTDYAEVRSASQAAVSGLKACEGQFLNDPDTALAILLKYMDNNDYKWLLGNETNSNTEQRIQVGNGECSARILGFDETNYFIRIESIGYASKGGKKRAVASYHLGGLGQNNTQIINHGLFLGGKIQNLNEAISIKGNVYFRMPDGGGQQLNTSATINGNFKTGQSTAQLTLNQRLTITGTAFFQCKLAPQGPDMHRVYGKAGFTGGFNNFNTVIQLYDDAYLISENNVNGNNRIEGQSEKTVTYSDPITESLFYGFGTENRDDSQDANTIAANLGTTTDNEVPLDYELPDWETGVVHDISGDISGNTLENYWNYHEDAGTLYQDKWLVLNMTGTVNAKGGTFTKKSIWITNNNSFSGDFYCGTSTTLFIVNQSVNINFQVPDNCNFQGLIYVNTPNEHDINYKFGLNSILYGAIHHTENARFNINGGNCDSVRIYSTDPLAQTALQEIMETGIIQGQGEADDSDASIVLIDKKIRPTLLGMQL